MPRKTALPRMWWTRGRPFSLAELIADGVVHGIGLAVAVALGTVLLVFAGLQTAPTAMPALIVYVATLLAVLGISMAFNLWPPASP